MWESLGYIGALVVLGGFITTLAKAVRTSKLKRVGWIVEFHHDDDDNEEKKPPKQINK
jgi:hypothetical protein